MKKLNLLFLFCLSFIFVSCDKDSDELIVTIKRTGTLTFNVNDGASPLKGAIIQIYDNYNYPIVEGSTDDSGEFVTEELLENNYACYISYVRDGVSYFENKSVQVIAGNNMIVKSDPLDDVAKVSVFVYQWYNNRPVSGVNVTLLPIGISYHSISELISKAHFILKTDSSGLVIFNKVPLTVQYRVVVYNDSGFIYGETSFINFYKDKETYIPFDL